MIFRSIINNAFFGGGISQRFPIVDEVNISKRLGSISNPMSPSYTETTQNFQLYPIVCQILLPEVSNLSHGMLWSKYLFVEMTYILSHPIKAWKN